jgi:signal transduction histidine kinase
VADRTTSLQTTVSQLETEISKRQQLEREILSISEREQCRIGMDLHEGLGQELTGISFIGDVMASRLEADSHPLSETAAQMTRSIRSLISTTSLLAKGLYPVELDRYGLLTALGDLAHRTQEQYGIACSVESEKLPKGKKSSEIHIFRIVQECVVNAIKHAAANKITIEVRRHGETTCFAVTDDGIGFDPSKKRSGMGLEIMDYRMREIGGEIRIEKPTHGGSRILVLIPD